MPLITFISPDGSRKTYEAYDGETLLSLAHRNNVDLEGACEGSLACSTCHVIIDPSWYDIVEQHNEISDEENDMLDLAFGLTDTSRLGCQIILTKELDGLCVILPTETRNISFVKNS
ncbi:2Fe-2S iron-sulfur cluster binding domain protein [Ehrlichia chaffeensis str. Heartland]|uniref:Adrenodoxin-like protein n=1 Tax=Ehrlichia chaffeensis (strain ATCC CRL-10679 / Arkansas) TaxID=205920 RepID=Q2GGI9_EHRCR|nr:ferredoxin family 2Fe-2S iron-sulfur cluster binding protein [Ehrlichia chaffeensis]2MJ3_A Chain A, Iron-sulfur cluster binding protein [Ehrlichia chaffeensis str. Arkansas]ABD45498.1 iron-sulfur cluster binding protein [Ehrlichia chaffeensis str. Arkansas]AHX03715.1 2Fe-2S iron-sulfur cluster binding domain protein [Ehrlichia chaffeensis str. Heartland]AHX05564.1 2Fe-2S iron-sulfur cluster binding domain protein [Ehrlichia chaffeensis str. Jax]AHX06554.1 2Fe-2S iron-sulfur cluster binding 